MVPGQVNIVGLYLFIIRYAAKKLLLKYEFRKCFENARRMVY